ncbi:hypothetical protein SAMN04489730_4769 [Amycolatopsis australiensis]|uniref:Uncharacterized protein n=1 Tax=Amycolatopsis australiensis TaxID=546364 RepID=A0A1K1S5H1_9PSEU|nr:hypothetical protein SAMN04489730_4769 [Amycolatopsis australiensis]
MTARTLVGDAGAAVCRAAQGRESGAVTCGAEVRAEGAA